MMSGDPETLRPGVNKIHGWFARWGWPWLAGVLAYTGLALVLLRGDFGGGGGLPQGTNALNTYTIFVFQQHHGLSVWLAPYTDWGQPSPVYPGADPQNLLAATGLVGPTQYIRATEFAAFVASGLAMCWAVVELGGTKSAALVAGAFYLFMAEVTQFFEGHVPAMVSVALAPLLIVLTWRFFRAPTVRPGIALAVVLYVMTSLGDLGFLYKFLFFASLLALGLIVYRLARRPYSKEELVAVTVSTAILLVLLLPWLVAYVGGVRPEFTAGINYSTLPFGQTAGQAAYPAFIGATGENSFTLFALGSPTYALDYGLTAPLYAIIPACVALYVIVLGRWRERLLYASGLLAMVLSIGPTYPGLGAVNGAVYTWVPLFDADPSLVHWSAYYLIAIALLFGLALSEAERRWLPRSAIVVPSSTATKRWARWSGWARLSRSMARRRGVALAVTAAVVLAGLALPALENWEAVTEPPGLFEYPGNYTAAFTFVASQPAQGGVLSVPFGNIYERTPWGGVSSSSQLFEGLATGRNLAIFEAGSPESLSLDQVIGDGLAHGGSDDLVKLWNATGIQYVVGTDYPNWNYASDPVYLPSDSYRGLTEQVGLGAPVFRSSLQTVYQIPDPAGNVSIFHEYYLYDGNESLVFELLSEPWYTGAQALVSLGDVPESAVNATIDHASAFVTDPAGLEALPNWVWVELSTSRTPLVVLIGAPAFVPDTVRLFEDPWNASDGVAFATRSAAAPAVSVPFVSVLRAHGYLAASVTVQGDGPAGSVVRIATGGAEVSGGSPTEVAGGLAAATAQAGGGPSVPLGQLDMRSGTTAQVEASPSVRLDTVTFEFGSPSSSSSARDDIYAHQSDVADEEFTMNGAGWSLVQMDQAYSPLWSLVGPVATQYHLIADIGLNAWLVNSSGSPTVHLVYRGTQVLADANVAEGVGLLLLAAAVPALYRRKRSRGAKIPAGPSSLEAGPATPP